MVLNQVVEVLCVDFVPCKDSSSLSCHHIAFVLPRLIKGIARFEARWMKEVIHRPKGVDSNGCSFLLSKGIGNGQNGLKKESCLNYALGQDSMELSQSPQDVAHAEEQVIVKEERVVVYF